MLIIRINGQITLEDYLRYCENIRAQAAAGIIVLPPWCELLNEVPQDQEIQILQQKDDDRVAALEAQLARAMADLCRAHKCESCKHEPIDPVDCYESGYACKQCKETGCWCRDCDDGSKWEWRGSHGAE